MKIYRLTHLVTCAALLAGAGSLAHAADKDKKNKHMDAEKPVSVNYENPGDFTDMKDSFQGTTKGMEGYQEQFRRDIKQLAKGSLPDGYTLEITFTDVDMAGDFEPSRGADAFDIRLVKAIYPPRLKFNYTVRDASGSVVKEGSENLSDLSFQTNIGINRSDTFFYEKELMRDWMRDLNLKKNANA